MSNKNKVIVGDLSHLFFEEENNNVEDIQLDFTVKKDNKEQNIYLKNFLFVKTSNMTDKEYSNILLQQKKDLLQFKSFILNNQRSIKILKSYQLAFSKLYSFQNDLNKPFILEFNTICEFLEKFYSVSKDRYNKQELKNDSFYTIKNQLKTILFECYNFPMKDFKRIVPELAYRTGKLSNPTILDNNSKIKAHSKEDFIELSRMFIKFYEYLCLIETKENVSEFSKKNPFQYKDIMEYKMRSYNDQFLYNLKTSTLLMSFICMTGANLTTAMSLKMDSIIYDETRKDVISIKMICNRKNKIQNHVFVIKKYQKQYFDMILNNAKNLNEKFPNELQLLFPKVNAQYKINKIEDFSELNIHIINEKYHFTPRTLRASFGNTFESIDERSAALFNSPSTAAKHYSTGNAEETNNKLQDAMNIYTLSLTQSKSYEDAKQQLIDIKIIDADSIIQLKNDNNVKLSSNGLLCVSNKDSTEDNKFIRKLEKLDLHNISSISCANILACFYCQYSILSTDFNSVYLLKSLLNYLNTSVYDNNISSLFTDDNSIKRSILYIEEIINKKIDKKISKEVDKFIKQNNYHPLWLREE